MARNAIVNCAELVTYDLIKDSLLKANIMSGELGGSMMLGLSLAMPRVPPVHPQLAECSFSSH